MQIIKSHEYAIDVLIHSKPMSASNFVKNCGLMKAVIKLLNVEVKINEKYVQSLMLDDIHYTLEGRKVNADEKATISKLITHYKKEFTRELNKL